MRKPLLTGFALIAALPASLLSVSCNTATSRAQKAYALTEAAQESALAKVSVALNETLPPETLDNYRRNLKSIKVKNEGDALVQACMDYLDQLAGTFQKIHDEAVFPFAGKIDTLERQLGIYKQYASNSLMRSQGVARGFEKGAADAEAKLQAARTDLEAVTKQFAPMREAISDIKKAKNQVLEIGANR